MLSVFEKWGLDGVIVGTVEPSRDSASAITACSSPTFPTSRSPTTRRSTTGPSASGRRPFPLDPSEEVQAQLAEDRDFTADLIKLLSSSNVCSKRWVHEQYDTMVQTNTVHRPRRRSRRNAHQGHRNAGHERGLAMALDGNGRWAYMNPKLGAMHAVAEAARKVAFLRRNAGCRHQLPQLRQS